MLLLAALQAAPHASVGSTTFWVAFLSFVLVMLALDLGVFHRKDHVVRYREALIWTAVWVSSALLFALWVTSRVGKQAGLEFVTGYLIEQSLSVDNIFVFVVIFEAMRVPPLYQHRVLFWGILTALVLRAAMIFAGTAMIERFHWMMYVFGGFLVITGIKLFVQRNKEENPEDSWAMRMTRKLIPSTSRIEGPQFFTRVEGRRLATPLFLTLVLVEITDVIFAVDSIPAIFAITTDPFIVFTSNIFAILGLRSLFFLVGGLVEKFRYLKIGLSGVLVFVGTKMTIVSIYKIPAAGSLVVILSILGASMLASWMADRSERNGD